jgi:DNA-binding protein HU-beta
MKKAKPVAFCPPFVSVSPTFESTTSKYHERFKAMASASQPTVTLKHISADLAEKHKQPKKQMNQILEDLVSHIVKNLKKGNRIRVAGLGILQVRKRAARMGRNPATGETIQIPAKKKIAFRAAKELKEAVGK